jgi:hypothetical protein
LRRISTGTPTAVLEVLPAAQLTGLTSLGGSTKDWPLEARLSPGVQASISQLAALEELHCAPWRGMAQQLAGLQQLRRLRLEPIGRDGVQVVAGEVQQLGALTQLRELVLAGELSHAHFSAEHRQLALKLVRALPSCLVRISCRVDGE